MTIDTLINKQDNVEIVRDQIAAILAIEVASQRAMAIAAGKDPNDWTLRVYTEASNPWNQYLEDNPADVSPLVNVWWSSSTYDGGASNIVERQKSDAVFYLDCYGYAVSKDDPAGGHSPGDREAALVCQRAVRLVRNILMAAEYTYLGLQGTVWKRWPQSVTIFQPEAENPAAQQIVAARLAFQVSFNEFSPQVTPVILEYLATDVKRAEDGLIVVETDYDYTI